MIYGNRIKEARKKKGYSQQQLGDLLGVSKVSICSYEKGNRTPTMKNFLDLVDYLELDPNYMLGRDTSVVAEGNAPFTVSFSKEDIAIVQEFKNHPVVYQKLVSDPKRTVELIERKLNK